jgi:hypothetical protein
MSQAKPPVTASPPTIPRIGKLHLAIWQGEDGMIYRLIPFNNGLSGLRPIQHEDGL